MDSVKKIRKISCLIAFGLIIGIVAVFLRGPHISNALKKIILPEIEMATGHKVIAQKIYINIYQLYELKQATRPGSNNNNKREAARRHTWAMY